MRLRSITRQAIGTVLIAELFCALLFTGASLLHEWNARMRALDVEIEGRSDSLLGAIQDAEDPDDNVVLDPGELRVPPHDFYAVYGGDGRLLGASEDSPDRERGRGPGLRSIRWHRRRYRVLERPGMRVIDRAEHAGVGLRRPVWIVYGVPEDHVWHEALQGAAYSVALSALLLLGTALFLVGRLRKLLEPIGELAEQAGGISARSLAFRSPESALALTELRPLAETLSAMAQRLRTSFEQQHRFVGDAAHELKTAVAVVRSTVQLLTLRPRTAAEYRAGLDEVLIDNARVEELTARMLMLARVEERPSPADETAELGRTATTVITRLRRLAERSGVELAFEGDSDLPVRASAADLEVLLSNLLVNAIEHSALRGRVTIAVADGGLQASLRVRDEGEGIAAEALPHVFERFYRVDSSRTRRTGGAGLGLAISKAIVEAAGGEISISSAPGHGTCVTVLLPLARDAVSGVRMAELSGDVKVSGR